MSFDRIDFDLWALLNDDRRFHPSEDAHLDMIGEWTRQVKNLSLLLQWTREAHDELGEEMDCHCDEDMQYCHACNMTQFGHLTNGEALQIVRLLCGL